jgi:glycosyltransferase involved in cell wall biosynthesis
VLHDVQLSVPSGLIIKGHERSLLVSGPLQKWYEVKCRRRFHSPDAVISPSKFLLGYYRSRSFFYQSQCHVIPNPAPDIALPERPARAPGGPLRLLFVGQLASHKGLGFLLDAIHTLNVPVELAIAGNGRMLDRVLREAAEDQRVRYLGALSLEALVAEYAKADATVIPSLCYENSPNVIYESLRAGTPVLASDIGGVCELVKGGRNGFVFDPGDRVSFAHAVEKLLEHRDRMWRSVEDIRSTVEPHLMEHYIDKIEPLLAPRKNFQID